MEFPEDIKKNILSYLPYPYKKPLHLDVIKTSKQYRIQIYKKPPHLYVFKKSGLIIDFIFNKLFFMEYEYKETDIENSIHSIWINSVMEFKNFKFPQPHFTQRSR